MQRSKIEMLPAEVRAELEQRLTDSSFSGYTALAEWLQGHGFEIHRSSVYRFGTKFEERVHALKRSTDQARAVVTASPDDDGAMNEALVRLSQQKAFDLLMDMEIDPDSIEFPKLMRAIADMNRSSVALKKFREEVRLRAQAAADRVTEKLRSSRGMSAEVADEIRREILGVAPK